jgi:hypothetical protein
MIRKSSIFFILILLLAACPLLAAEKAGSKDSTKTGKHPITLSVEDLGFAGNEIKADPQAQRDLQARSDMLKIHQTLGLITAIPLTTEFVLGLVTSGNVANGSTDTGLHAVLGISTAVLYESTALFAILAPKPKGLKPSGNTAFHVDLAWVHAPLMIAVPIVGGILNNRVQNHQPVGDLRDIHGIMAAALVLSYLTSVTVMTF